jgi:glutaredoxin|tara:strand:- start:1026 stop:1289 length:264 start_codon:yes stop_codon:yes gene_type:complete
MSIIVYSKPSCVYCDKAKSLLKRLGYEYEEKIVTKDITLEQLFEALGKQVRTIPQIVIDEKHIGGYNELKEYFVDQGKINFEGEQIG